MVFPSSESSGWDPRPLDDPIQKQKPSIIPNEVLTLHDVPTARNAPLDRDAFQYPVVPINETSRLHLVPVYSGLFIVLTDPDTATVKSTTRQDCDFYLTYEGRHKVAEQLTQGMHDAFKSDENLKSDLLTTLQEAACLRDPFDETVTAQFRPPVVRWIRRRTVDVQFSGASDLNNPSSNASWNITLEASEGGTRTNTISIAHQKFLSSQSSVFRSRYKRTFPQQSHLQLSNGWWLDLCKFFIEQASYEGVNLQAIENKRANSVEYRQSGTGTFHLTGVGETEAACGCSVRSSTTRSFDPIGVPLPAAVCANCAPEIKRHLISIRI